jgi:hypothetical protein
MAATFNADLLSFLPTQAALADRVVPSTSVRDDVRAKRDASDGPALSR